MAPLQCNIIIGRDDVATPIDALRSGLGLAAPT